MQILICRIGVGGFIQIQAQIFAQPSRSASPPRRGEGKHVNIKTRKPYDQRAGCTPHAGTAPPRGPYAMAGSPAAADPNTLRRSDPAASRPFALAIVRATGSALQPSPASA